MRRLGTGVASDHLVERVVADAVLAADWDAAADSSNTTVPSEPGDHLDGMRGAGRPIETPIRGRRPATMNRMPHSMLEEADAAAVLGVVEDLTTAETIDEFARLAMRGLRELIPCIDVSYNEMNPSAGRIEWRAEPANPRMAEFAPVFSRLMRQNPLVGYFERTSDTRAMMWSDLMPFEKLERTELYQEMFRPLGIRSQMAMILPTPPGIVVGFAANTDRPSFSERDRAVFNTLRPHLAHFYRSIQLRDLVRRSPGWTGALADEHGIVHAVTDDAADLADQSGRDAR